MGVNAPAWMNELTLDLVIGPFLLLLVFAQYVFDAY